MQFAWGLSHAEGQGQVWWPVPWQQLVVAVEEGDGAVAVQRRSGARALVQQGDDPWVMRGRQAGGKLILEGVLHTLPAALGQASPRTEYKTHMAKPSEPGFLPRADAFRAECSSDKSDALIWALTILVRLGRQLSVQRR
ncbi:TPA: hypothetical protein ACH3X1_016245 [Trebouxia sp. C0004]